MRTLRILSWCAAGLLMAASVSAQPLVRTFDVSAGGTLDLRLEAGGDVTITGGASEVRVEIRREGRDAEDVDFSFDERGDRIVVRSEYEYRGNHRADIDYEISVPSRFNVDIALTGGDVSISGVTGTFEGQTMGGEISLTRVAGRAELQTMGGQITVRDSELEGKVHTMGGEIVMDSVQGDVEATTMGGDVSFRGSLNATRIHTMGGDIDVEDSPRGADVTTMGGDITIGEVGEFLKAETMGGDIEADAVNGWIEAKTMGGDVQVRMVGGTSGDRHVEITSMGGDIELVVPRGLGMDIDVEVIVEGRSKDPSDYVIESDFDLNVSVPANARRGERTRLMAVGSVGNGANEVRIRTVNGNVRILADR
ncbi:MAG: DUF4097 family beta strand repeat protein [Rhodothermales bacterium]|nr:DUF4097 family beta strand repeat protein [Rhodothermales bacterium]MBO6778954.1 DUF4097 family beta strand repeat protein [Rhodothermales bacterium]